MDEQLLMTMTDFLNPQRFHLAMISPEKISSSEVQVPVSKKQKEIDKDPANVLFLPNDLLVTIMRHLSSMAAFSTFRAVCPSWRSLATACPENFACQSPLILLASPKADILGFYDITCKRLYNIRLYLQIPQEPHCIGEYYTMRISYSHGFLVVANMPGYSEIMLYNIFTGNRIMLPAVNKRTWYKFQVIFSSSPVSPGCVVVMFMHRSQSFRYCRIGDLEWKCHCLNGYPRICDMQFFYGKLYALTYDGKLVSIDFACCQRHILVKKEYKLGDTTAWDVSENYFTPSQCRLAQSCSELLLVKENHQYAGDTDLFNIYRWDFSASTWAEVTSLGGRALFFGRTGFLASISSTCNGVRDDCIYYFLENDYFEMRKTRKIIWIEFSLNDRTFRTVYQEPPNKELTSFMTWILPSMS